VVKVSEESEGLVLGAPHLFALVVSEGSPFDRILPQQLLEEVVVVVVVVEGSAFDRIVSIARNTEQHRRSQGHLILSQEQHAQQVLRLQHLDEFESLCHGNRSGHICRLSSIPYVHGVI